MSKDYEFIDLFKDFATPVLLILILIAQIFSTAIIVDRLRSVETAAALNQLDCLGNSTAPCHVTIN